MKLISHSQTARTALAVLLLISAFSLLGLTFSDALAENKFFGRSVSQAQVAQPTASVPSPFNGTYDPHVFPCGSARHHFMVPTGQTRIVVQTTATVPTNDLTVSLLFGPDPNPVFIDTEDGGTSSEALVWEPAGGVPAGEYQVQICQTPTPNGVPQMAPFTYNGTFTYDDGPVVGGASTPQFGPISPAPQDTGAKIGYESFEAPGELVTMTSSSQGPSAATVEYLGHDAGEPSVGVNWNSTQDPVNGITAFQSDLQTVFVKFDDSCPAGSSAQFYRSQSPTSQFVNSDPIGFVDSITGRVFCGQLTLLNPTCKISFTDTDGKDPLGNPGPNGWQGSSTPLGSGVDHQTVGGGPYHSPLPPTKPGYAHAVYYASQDLVGPAFAFRSDDGGLIWQGPFDMWTTQCGGLHGHAKVTPNTAATVANGRVGTVFVPNNGCGNNGAAVVSETNGLTWSIRPIGQTTSNPNFQDPAISIDGNGRVYFFMSSNVAAGPASGGGGSQMVVAVSDDNGVNWTNIYDVGAIYNLRNVMYPAAVAGEGGRAAVAFLGSTVGGDPTVPSYTGVWHLYVAHTFDGGAHWTTTDATPNDPVQRGPIWAHGQADISRNMLDFFDMTVDKQGRVQVGYADGCVDGHCIQTKSVNGNGYTDRMVITRQSSGRRMIANPNPAVPAQEPPGIPALSIRRDGPAGVRLSWSEADPGTSAISKYQVLRGETAGGETLLADNIPASHNTYDDTTATDPAKTYYYEVVAVNGVGSSCPNNEIAAPYLGDTCTRLIMQKTPPGHPEQPAQGAAPPSLAIDHVAVGEPPGTTNLLFQMKVTNMGTPPPNSRWRVVWNSYAATAYPSTPLPQQFYVGMTTDENSVARFEWGTVATAVVGLVIGNPTETERGSLPDSNFSADGTINLIIPKRLVGNVAPGDLLGAVNGRTFTGDTPETENLERSTLMVDHTFVKAQRDNGHPAATYVVAGNGFCSGGIGLISAVSRKTHGTAGTFDIPLYGPNNIECRKGQGPNGNNHQVVIKFDTTLPVTVNSVVISPGPGKTADLAGAPIINGNEITLNLTNVSNAQTLMINLIGLSDGFDTGDTSIPMNVLLGDVDASRRVDSTDVFQVRQQSLQNAKASNFRADVETSGRIDSTDVFVTRQQSLTALP